MRPPYRMSAVCRLLGVLVVTATVAHAGRALAAPTSTELTAARALFGQAVADEQAGRWGDALVKIRRASAVKMTPGLRFHIALCEEKTGHLVAALDDYAAAQIGARAEGNREVLGLVSEPLLSLKVRLPTLTVNVPSRFTSGDTRAELRLDGDPLRAESLGLPMPVDVGSHTIQASAVGKTPYAVTITVVERQAATVDVQLTPLPGYVEPAPAAAPAAAPPPAHLEETGRGPRTLAITATVGAVVLIGGGIGAYAAAGSAQSSLRAECNSSGCGSPTPTRAWDAVALGAWIAGAGAGVAAVVLWARPADQARDSAHAELRVGPGTLSLQGTF